MTFYDVGVYRFRIHLRGGQFLLLVNVVLPLGKGLEQVFADFRLSPARVNRVGQPNQVKDKGGRHRKTQAFELTHDLIHQRCVEDVGIC